MSTPTPPPFTDPAATWNQRFAGEHYHFGTAPNAWLREQAAVLPPQAKVLCVADGEGRNSVWLAEQGHSVQAFDIASTGVDKARALAQSRGVAVQYQVADGDGFAWPVGAVDAVVAIFVQFADPALRARLFAHMVASLKPGGLVLLLGYTPKQLDYRTGGPSVLSHLYTAPMLREAFNGLDILSLDEFEADVQEGAGHSGRSAMVGLVARRP
jgi:SAM-dependent methyltransferase